MSDKPFRNVIPSGPYRQAAGTVTVAFVASNQATAAVTFPAGRFTVAPIITQSVQGAGSSAVTVVRMSGSPSTSGFTCVVNASASITASVVVGWYAVQMTPSSAAG